MHPISAPIRRISFKIYSEIPVEAITTGISFSSFKQQNQILYAPETSCKKTSLNDKNHNYISAHKSIKDYIVKDNTNKKQYLFSSFTPFCYQSIISNP